MVGEIHTGGVKVRIPNGRLVAFVSALLVSSMVLVPGCGMDELPEVPDADDSNGATEPAEPDEGDAGNGGPTEVPGEDPPGIVPVPSDAVRVRYVAEENQGMATYAVPADAEDIVEFYRTELEQLGWANDYEESAGDKMVLGAQDEGGQTIVVEIHYDSTEWSGYTEVDLGWEIH